MPERSALDEHIRSLRIIVEAFEKMRQVGDFYVGGTRFAVSAHPNSHFDDRGADDMKPMEAAMTRLINDRRDELVSQLWQEVARTIEDGIAVACETEPAALKAVRRLAAPVEKEAA